jgi:chemotaxis protein methyltransferase CheR
MDQSQIANGKSQMESLRQWAEAETGMDLSGARFSRLRDAVEKVLSRHKPAVNLDRILTRPRERTVFLEQLAAELTVGESFFFRNEYHFQALRDHVIPEILKENAAEREIRIWNAGCATGEEPYSLAILLDRMLDHRKSQITNQEPGWHVSILATDLNPEFLERARSGRYREWSFRGTDIHHDRNYFSPEGQEYCLVERVRNHVRFGYLNLVKDMYPSPLSGTAGLDLILFRNVAIYLRRDVTKAIIDRLRGALRPGGWLLLGETELTLASTEGFEVERFEQATFFRKPAERAAVAEQARQPPLPVLASVTEPVGGTPGVVAGTTPDWAPLPTPAPPKSTSAAVSTRRAGSVPSVWERIERFVADRHFDEAERTIDRISRQKDRATARSQYALALVNCAEIVRAHQMLDVCLEEEPLLIEAQLLKACFAEEAGDLAAAEQAYRRALYIDRNCPMAHFHLALVQQQRDDAAGARRSLRTVLDLTEGKDAHAVVEHGDGVCYGRLREMAEVILDF